MSILDKNIDPATVISAGLSGTTMMTLFSYLVSRSKNQNFRIPQLNKNIGGLQAGICTIQ